MRTIFILILLLFLEINSFGQKMSGFGGELSVVGIKPNYRSWISKTKGFEVFGGVSAELGDFKPNDYEGGFKLLNTFLYDRKNRTYFGLVGKWKYLNLEGTQTTTNLPVVGLLIGKEWSRKQKHRRGFAIELGYQYGSKSYNIYTTTIDHTFIARKTYEEFPLMINLRYSFYKDR